MSHVFAVLFACKVRSPLVMYLHIMYVACIFCCVYFDTCGTLVPFHLLTWYLYKLIVKRNKISKSKRLLSPIFTRIGFMVLSSDRLGIWCYLHADWIYGVIFTRIGYMLLFSRGLGIWCYLRADSVYVVIFTRMPKVSSLSCVHLRIGRHCPSFLHPHPPSLFS